MKNQILSLITSAVLFAATPAFCMEEKEKPEGHFSKLAHEQKIEILNKLYTPVYKPADVGSVKCLSKEFYELLKDRKKFTLKLRYHNGILENPESYDNVKFCLSYADEENEVSLGEFSMVALENGRTALIEKDLTIFCLPRNTIRFQIKIEEPSFCQSYCDARKMEEFKYVEEGPLLKSKLTENTILRASIYIAPNALKPGENHVTLTLSKI